MYRYKHEVCRGFTGPDEAPRPENTSALLIIVPFVRPASEIPNLLLGFGRGFNRRKTKRATCGPIDNAFKHTFGTNIHLAQTYIWHKTYRYQFSEYTRRVSVQCLSRSDIAQT
jgi:hypothetical protein